MANFILYKYTFEQTHERHLFSDKSGEALTASNLNKRLGKDLDDKCRGNAEHRLELYTTRRGGKSQETSESFSNTLTNADNGIIMLQIHNNKSKQIMPIDRTVAERVGHYPFCRVIIDTRPDSQAILVQYKKDIFNRPDDVISLLTEYISREYNLSYLGWSITAEKRICKGTIWDIVHSRIDKGRDKVKSVTLKFDAKRPNEENEVDKALQFLLDKLDSPEGELTLTSGDPAKRLLDETHKDIRNTIDMLIENKYRMKVGFEKSGVVEYGKETEVIYGIADSVCTDFEDGVREIGETATPLQLWLDTLMPDESAHTYIQTKQKKNGRRKSR